MASHIVARIHVCAVLHLIFLLPLGDSHFTRARLKSEILIEFTFYAFFILFATEARLENYLHNFKCE